MAKKESAKRGYMTKEEIMDHIKRTMYKSKDPDVKFNLTPPKWTRRIKNYDTYAPTIYLTKLLGKRALLSEKTRQNAFEVIGELYEKLGSPIEAGEYFDLAGKYQKAAECFESCRSGANEADLEVRKKVRRAGEIRESLGQYEKAFNDYVFTGDNRKVEELKLKMRKPAKGLDSRLSSVIAIAGLGAGLFFLSSNITGNVIGSRAISNWIGAVLLIVGLVAGFFWVKNRKK